MNIQNRLKKIESTIKVTDNLCQCPDALAMIATPFQNSCYKCLREIDYMTWKHWQVINPHNEETNFYAFGLRRDDKQELTDKPVSYFDNEVLTVRWFIHLKRIGWFDWLDTLTEKEKAEGVKECDKAERDSIPFEETKIYRRFIECMRIENEETE